MTAERPFFPCARCREAGQPVMVRLYWGSTFGDAGGVNLCRSCLGLPTTLEDQHRDPDKLRRLASRLLGYLRGATPVKP